MTAAFVMQHNARRNFRATTHCMAMYLVVIAWLYVVLMMSLVEALGSQGSVLGAVVTFLLYGVLPLSIVMYLLGTPMRRRARRLAEARSRADRPPSVVDVERGMDDAATAGAHDEAVAESAASVVPDPDGRGHASGHAVAPIRKEP